MPVEFRMESKSGNVLENTRSADWVRERVSHYTGIGTEVRENYNGGSTAETKVVVIMPNRLGRYLPEDAVDGLNGVSGSQLAGYRPPAKFEWYLKNHLGSTMLVYGTQPYNDKYSSYAGGVKAAYDYRAFGEQVSLAEPTDKVTENFTGKEKDDETELNYFGARYLDPMLGLWVSVDPARQFSSPYLYVGNGVNPLNAIDPDGNYTLNLNEDNTVASMVADDNLNTVSVKGANGDLLNTFDAPPAESYFFSMTNDQYNIVNQKFDLNMQQNVNEMLDAAYSIWPLDAPLWYSNFPLDFKHTYYEGAVNTVGVLNGTIMTARDVGNAVWGGWARYMYSCSPRVMDFISNAIAGGNEDAPSAVMQNWGYDNYKP